MVMVLGVEEIEHLDLAHEVLHPQGAAVVAVMKIWRACTLRSILILCQRPSSNGLNSSFHKPNLVRTVDKTWSSL